MQLELFGCGGLLVSHLGISYNIGIHITYVHTDIAALIGLHTNWECKLGKFLGARLKVLFKS